MRRRAVIGFVAVLAVGLIAVAGVGLTRGSSLVYALGAAPAGTFVTVAPGAVACQTPISVPDGAEFDRVVFSPSTFGKPGPELTVEVREVASRRRLARGTLAAGYPDITQAPRQVVEVGRVATGAPIEVCLRNTGDDRVGIHGQPGIASPRTHATLDGKQIPVDMAITLNREERSFLALLPSIADRASLFRAGWVTPLTYLILALLVVIAVPLLLVRGMARAAAADDAPSAEQGEDEPPVATHERPQEARPAGAAQER
jgi:hypothetical protein